MESKQNIIEEEDGISIEIQDYSFSIDLKSDKLRYTLRNQGSALIHATSAILIEMGKHIEPLLPTGTQSEKWKYDVKDVNNEIGKGTAISFKCVFKSNSSKSRDVSIPAEVRFTLYNTLSSRFTSIPFLTIDITLDTIPDNLKQERLYGYAPLYMKDQGKLYLEPSCVKNQGVERNGDTYSCNPKNITFYSNGYQSWSLNHLHDYNCKFRPCVSKIGRINMENQDTKLSGRYQSEYHGVITDIESESSLVLSFITLKD